MGGYSKIEKTAPSAAELLLKKTARSVWQRGEEYADKGLVQIRTMTEKSVEAVVKGSKPYHVSLSFPGNGIRKKCDCPYSAGSTAQHAACKHMVAVAVLWDENRGIKRPGRAVIEAATIPPHLVSRAEISAMYDDPLNADLNVMRICVDERGGWSRPHAKLPLMPPFAAAVSIPLTLAEVKAAFAEMRRWTHRSSFDPYFCAGEMTAAFCDVLRIIRKRMAITDPDVVLDVLNACVKFHHDLLARIDSSDGVHIFSDAHLRDLCEGFREILPDDGKREERAARVKELEGEIGRY